MPLDFLVRLKWFYFYGDSILEIAFSADFNNIEP